MDKPLFYMLVVFGLLGSAYPADVRFLAEPPENLYSFTKGEGQALLFKLDDFDCSTQFHAALKSGEVAAEFGRMVWSLHKGRAITNFSTERKVPDGK